MLSLISIFQKPFLEGVEHLTEDVVSVFPAADSLEQYVIALITSTCEEGTADSYCKKLALYKVSKNEAEKRWHFHLIKLFVMLQQQEFVTSAFCTYF